MRNGAHLSDRSSRWARWRRLPGSDRRVLIALAVLLPAADLALRSAGLQRSRRWLKYWTRNVKPQPCSDDALARAQRLAELAAIAGQHGLYRNTCLRQALVVQGWLLRRGLPAELKLGARKPADGNVDAHAWVELNGKALAQADLRHTSFSGLDRLSR